MDNETLAHAAWPKSTAGDTRKVFGRPNLRVGWRTAAFVLSASTVLVGSILVLHYAGGIPVGVLTQDPLFQRPVYVGLLSQAGILLWAAAAAVSLMAAAVLSQQDGQEGHARFFLAGGLLSVLLCLDDAFLIHDSLLPSIGVGEKVVYLAYLIAILAFLFVFRTRILSTEFLILVAAFCFFALAIVGDLYGIRPINRFLLEDGSKVVGIVAWLAYFWSSAVTALRSA